MKKALSIALVLVFAVSFAAYTGSKEEEKDSTNPPITENNSETNTEKETKNTETHKILVAYFSATNTTERVAQDIADSLNCDIFEIVPQNPYTDDDLNYHNSNSRTSIEMNDESARPAIASSVENIEQYDTIFIGYPIWWNDAPRIINTFLESYNFADKTIIPFCTSGGSGINASVSNLKNAFSNSKWENGKGFNGSSSKEEIAEWANSFNLK
ncbi:MAG: flavodoxin [Eubacterium sp.]|nr:flavodoxin [Eubacterium sp.]